MVGFLVALAVLTPAVGRAAAPSLQVVTTGTAATSLVSGPDGMVWVLARPGLDTFALERYDAGGLHSRLPVSVPMGDDPDSSSQPYVLSDLSPQADGGMAVVLGRHFDSSKDLVVVARFDRKAARMQTTLLPAVARAVDRFAVEPDGTVWFARLCRGALYRWTAGGGVTRFPLPGVRFECASGYDAAPIVLGPDGSVWIADMMWRFNGSRLRIVRRELSGRLHHWDASVSDPDGYPSYIRLSPDPRGDGVAYGGARSSTAEFAGRITPRGQLVPSKVSGQFAYAPDGTLWRTRVETTDGTIERIGPSGQPMRVAMAVEARSSAFALDRRAVPWTLAGTFHTLRSMEEFFDHLRFAPLLSLPAPSSMPDETLSLVPTFERQDEEMVLGADGALWGIVWSDVFRGEPSLVRLTPGSVSQPRRPRASVAAVLGTTDRSVALQLYCDADPGRYCTGTVRLLGASSVRRFLVGGLSRAVVWVELDRSARQALRRDGSLRTQVVVKSQGRVLRRRLLVRSADGR